MDTFKFRHEQPRALTGRIVHRSGMYIDLPPNWNAYELNDGTLIIGGKKEKGCLVFNVEPDPEFAEDNSVEVTDTTTENGFEVITLKPEKEIGPLKLWRNRTEYYYISFLYIGKEHQLADELNDVRAIIGSLVKNTLKEEDVQD